MAVRTFGDVSFDGRKWCLENLEPHVSIKIKALFPGIGKSAVKFYLDDRPDVAVDLDWFFKRYPFRINEESFLKLQDRVAEYHEGVKMVEDILLPDYKPREIKINGELRHYQAQAVDAYIAKKALLVGDDVGLGKTLVAVGSFIDTSTLPALVCVQTHLPAQWEAQIKKFTGLRVCKLKGRTPYDLPEADVYITKYSILGYWCEIYQKKFFKSVVFDEIQELRKGQGDKYTGAESIRKNVEYCLGLSATPIYNHGFEIYNIMNIIEPDCLGEEYDFRREWCGWGDKVKDPKALGAYLRERQIFIRRSRADVGMELPQVNKIVHDIDVDEGAIDSVMEIAKSLAVKTQTGSFIERGQAARELDIMVRHATGVGKAKYVAEYVKILLQNGESVLLAGWHRDVYDVWVEALKEFNPVLYTGSESPAQKEESKRKFVSGESKVMIISLRSGVGLDGLQFKASVVVIGELDWSPGVHEQLIGRLDRDGQSERVTAIYLVTNSGSDPVMVDLLGVKSTQAHGIVNPFTSAPETYSDESRIKMLAESILNGRKKDE